MPNQNRCPECHAEYESRRGLATHYAQVHSKNAKRKRALGLRLGRLRKQLGIRQEDLANLIGVDASMLSGWETANHPPFAKASVAAIREGIAYCEDEIAKTNPNSDLEGEVVETPRRTNGSAEQAQSAAEGDDAMLDAILRTVDPLRLIHAIGRVNENALNAILVSALEGMDAKDLPGHVFGQIPVWVLANEIARRTKS